MLVVETTNFTDKTRFRGPTEHLLLVERFGRIDADTLPYEFTVRDPTTWAAPRTAAIPMMKADASMFEYACHEGNYGMDGVLASHRADERAAADGGTPESR